MCTYVLVTVCNVVAHKCCHHCGVNVDTIVCNADNDMYILLSLYVNDAYVLVIGCDVAASKCCHWCDVNVTVTMCNAAYVAPPFPVKRDVIKIGIETETKQNRNSTCVIVEF